MRTVVIKLGGSLLAPDGIDIKFLSEFKSIVESYLKKGFRFGIVVGGGKLARRYQEAAKELMGEDQKALDLVGIEATKLNAYLVKTVFKNLANNTIITDYSKKIKTKKPVLIGAGFKPDWSTDYDAVVLAKKLGGNELIVLSNISQVYDKDPKIFKDAKPYYNLSWKEMLKICKGPWKPGLNTPLDPEAAKEGAKNRQRIVFVAGLKDLQYYLDGKRFEGTIIT